MDGVDEFLDSQGAALYQQSSRRVIMSLAHGLCKEVKDRVVTVQLASTIITAGKKTL